MLGVILSLVLLAPPTLEDALNDERVRSAVLSGLGNPANPAEIDAASVAYVSFGRSVYGSNTVPVQLLRPFQHLRILNAVDVELSASENLAELKSLREIALWRTSRTALAALKNLPALTHLTLRSMELTDEDAAVVAECGNLQFLDLRYNLVKSLKCFAGRKALKWLDIEGNPISRGEIDAFVAARPDVRLIYGALADPDEYVRRAWAGKRSGSITACAQARADSYRARSWNGKVPFHDGSVHSIRIMKSAGETGYTSCDAAVIVRYARFLKQEYPGQPGFLNDDAALQQFVENTGMPPDAEGSYSFSYVVDWIRKHKESQVLPPYVLLDDMLQMWEKIIR